MKYNDKDIEEYLNTDGAKLQLEINSQIATIVQLLYQKKIITEGEFFKTKDAIKEIIIKNIKEKIKQESENLNEEVK